MRRLALVLTLIVALAAGALVARGSEEERPPAARASDAPARTPAAPATPATPATPAERLGSSA